MIESSLTYGSDFWPTRDAGTVEALDWVWFGLGFTIASSIQLITSPILDWFPPCLVKWVTVFKFAFFFYLYMSAYMDSNYSDDQIMIGMILNFAQMG